MTAEFSKTLAKRLYEVLHTGDIGSLSEFAATNYEEHDPLPGQRAGLAGLEDRVTILRTGLAARFTIEDVIAEGDRVVVRWTNSGTHVGEFAGIPATGKSFTISGIDIYRVQDGKLAEHWHVVDQLSMLGQLGLLPAPQTA
ncbi:MAG: ester cyclase [Actinomycetota bacterium]